MSAVDLLRQMVPDHWQLKPLRSVADYQVSNVDKLIADSEEPVRLCNYVDVYHNEKIDLAVSFMPATATSGEIERFGLKVGDVLITKDSESWNDIGVPALIRETADDLVCGYHLAMIRPHEDQIDGEFLLRCIQAKPVSVQLELAANGITRFGIPKSAIGSLSIPVPPIPQQRRIIRYIDRQVEDIDALIGAKQDLQGLLTEKRRMLVAEAVMRGLDRSAPLRPSGLDWLGDIPAHWETAPLRFLVSFSSGGTPDTKKREFWDGEIPWVSAKDMKRDIIADSQDHVSELALSSSALKLIEEHAVLVVVRGMILAHSFPTAINTVPLTINQDLKALRCSERLNPFFLKVVLEGATRYLVDQADSSAHGTKKIDTDVLGALGLPVPPLDEQERIVSGIAEQRVKIDKLVSATERSIALLKERRSALIAAAVTGQIDIPEAA